MIMPILQLYCKDSRMTEGASVDISVAICTWNRCELLRKTLEQMTKLTIPPEVKWELLVVNNNSTDTTDAVIASFSDRLPIRRLFEPRQGHSNARNLALHYFRGKYLLWTDDDVLVEESWLAEYYKSFIRWPEAVYFGGKIAPWFEVPPPDWVQSNLKSFEAMLVIRDLGPDAFVFSPPEFPFGANMAFRREALQSVTFDPRLGKSGKNEMLGDDTAVIEELHRRGQIGVWVPDARVNHFVNKERLTVEYVWRFGFNSGRSTSLLGKFDKDARSKRWFGIPRYMYTFVIEYSVRSFLWRLRGNPRWVVDYKNVAWFCGAISELKASGRLWKQSHTMHHKRVAR
jgi:glucosyl-dolichyl phosphate glucuronosyltransferase